jgi:hypothetical protein
LTIARSTSILSPVSKTKTAPSKPKRQPPVVSSMLEALDWAGARPDGSTDAGKRPYATRLSAACASLLANRLRPDFPGVLPDARGRGQESRARSAKGFKKLDVNYSTVELGLALGVSIKTLNFRDPETQRYTKNYTRIDNELRAEAMDYHQRQPYAVLVGVLFLPADACDDASAGSKDESGVSSFGAALRFFRNRVPRPDVDDAPDLFERFFVAGYEHEGPRRGDVFFFDVMRKGAPRNRRPRAGEILDLDGLVAAIRATYDERNNPPFEWA